MASVSGDNRLVVSGVGGPPSITRLPSDDDVVLQTITDNEGTKVTGFRDPEAAGGLANQLQVLNPPLLLTNLPSAIDHADPTSALGSLKGKTLTIPAENTNDSTTANLVYLTSSGPNPVVTGYLFQGHVVTDLPADYKNLTVAAFAEKVSMAFNGSMQSLQGKSYAVSTNSVYADATVLTEGSVFYGEATGTQLSSSSGNKVVYGYQTPSGAQSVYEPPIPLSEFLKLMNQPGSPLKGLSLTMVETAPHTILPRSAMDTIAMPNSTVRANPYLQPSIAALLAILMMKVAQIDRDTAMKEDLAIENTMRASITQVAMSQTAIDQLNEVQRQQAIATITSAAISISGSLAALAMLVVAYVRYSRATSDQALNKPMVVNTPQTTPTPTASLAAAAAAGVPPAAPPPPPSSPGVSAATGAHLAQQQQMQAHDQDQADKRGEIRLVGSGVAPSDAATAVAPRENDEAARIDQARAQERTQQQAARQAQLQEQQARHQDAAGPPGAPQAQPAPHVASALASTSTAPSRRDVNRRIEDASERLKMDLKAADIIQTMARSVGQIIESSVTVATMRQKTLAEQAQAYLETYKNLNETFKGQLVSDRAQIENEFKSSLDVAKQMMDNEVNILRQTFGIPG